MTSVKKLFDLSGKTALITGGSRGLGLQIAEALGEQGANLILAARKQNELDDAREHLAKMGIKAHTIVADLGNRTDPAKLADAALAHAGQVDILVNNAGAAWGAKAEDHPLDGWDKLMNLNLTGTFLLTQAIGKKSMIPRQYGRIVTVASIAGLRGNAGTLAYNTTKGGLVNFTRALAAEWGVHNITVNAICPGFFPSKMTMATLAEVGAARIAATPLRRLGDDDDLKGTALLFASDAGKHITGQCLAVDGGVTAL
jgi:NAD(P)-dependent dehydrogenase (short-subunit alcohol dehydrogenase family)